jgi:stearoyl-CoA desaturase (delta-9 desaturase)
MPVTRLSPESTDHTEAASAPIDYWTMGFLLLTPVIGIVGTAAYTWWRGFEPWMLVLAVTMYAAVGMSICAGYHRFFSHKSYEASPIVQVFFAIFGGMAAQNSILQWSASHRVHHKHVDKDWDPYNIRRGFWWAHILWVFHRHQAPDLQATAPDLLRNPIALWQQRWYRTILIVGGFGVPTLIGAMFGDAIAGLLWGGFLRLVVIHHTTFFVNSLAHYVGKPTYNPEVSARDNWAVALLTLGEGYHSFHHRFPADFRNGVRWYHWDPAKWFIGGLKLVGLASDLRSTPAPQVEQARMEFEFRRLEPHLEGSSSERAIQVRTLISEAKTHLEEALALSRQHVHDRSVSASGAWREARRNVRRHLTQARRRWRQASSIAAAMTREQLQDPAGS